MLLLGVIKAVQKDAWEYHMPVAATVVTVYLWWTFEITNRFVLFWHHSLWHAIVSTIHNLYYSLLSSSINPFDIYSVSLTGRTWQQFFAVVYNFYQFYMMLVSKHPATMKHISQKGDVIYLSWYLLCARMVRLWPTCKFKHQDKTGSFTVEVRYQTFAQETLWTYSEIIRGYANAQPYH